MSTNATVNTSTTGAIIATTVTSAAVTGDYRTLIGISYGILNILGLGGNVLLIGR